MVNKLGKKTDLESLLGEDMIKLRENHHAKKLESHRKLQKWLNKRRYRAKLNEIYELSTSTERIISIGAGLFTAIFGTAQAGPPMDGGIGDLIWGYSLIALIFLFLFAVPAWFMLMAFAHYRK